MAQVDKQNPGLGGPIKAFWDQQRECQYCARDYAFTAEEQKFWYEERQFITDSAPVACPACRKKLREEIDANRDLAALGKAARDCSWQELEKRADLARKTGSQRKSLEYLRRAKNRCSEAECKGLLAHRVEEWLEKPVAPSERKFWRLNPRVDQIEMDFRAWKECQEGRA